MAPVQKTFTVIPTAWATAVTSAGGPSAQPAAAARPMTSKQVRKAYKAANKAPPMSKAERLRQERIEQERIRKELEKEKAAAKAKVLREKKKAKELAEKEEKKRKRLPLVSVRPSQDTIARFVRGNGTGKKRDCGGEKVAEGNDDEARVEISRVSPILEEDGNETEVDGDMGRGDEEAPKRSPQRMTDMEARIEDEKNDEELKEILQETEQNECEPMPVPVAETVASQPQALTRNDLMLNDDELDDDMMETIITIPLKTDVLPNEEQHTEAVENMAEEAVDAPLAPKARVKTPEPEFSDDLDALLEGDDFDIDAFALASSKSIIEVSAVSEKETPPLRRATIYERDLGLAMKSPEAPISREQFTKPPDPKLTSPLRTTMAPPPLPCRKSPVTTSPLARQPQAPPMSTQAILFNFDDFFPTFSQQARELEEEVDSFTSPIPPLSYETPAPLPKTPIGFPEPEVSSPSSSASSSPQGTPAPFFTSSGSKAQLAVAIERSKVTAARERREEKLRMKREVMMLERQRQKEIELQKLREERIARERLRRGKEAAGDTAGVDKPVSRMQTPRQPRRPTLQFAQKPYVEVRRREMTRPPERQAPQQKPVSKPITSGPHATVPQKNPSLKPIPHQNHNYRHQRRSSHASDKENIPPPLLTKPRPAAHTPTHPSRAPNNQPYTLAAAKPAPRAAQMSQRLTVPSPQVPQAVTATTMPQLQKPAPGGRADYMPASQESEYGGDWVDEASLELIL